MKTAPTDIRGAGSAATAAGLIDGPADAERFVAERVQQAGADVATHVPLDPGLDDAEAARALDAGRIAVPTLSVMETDSAPGAPATVPHGESLHHDLELLVDAGLSTVDALRPTTSLTARYLGLGDRAAIRTGLRADLVPVDGDPVADIRATRRIRSVWCGGVEHLPVLS